MRRAREFLQTFPRQRLVRTFDRRLAESGLSKGTLQWKKAPAGARVCQIRWELIDGTLQESESVAAQTREEAFSDALAKALKKNAAAKIDWRAAVREALARAGLPRKHVHVSFVESKREDARTLVSCCVSWGGAKEYFHRTEALPTMRDASMAAIEKIREALDKRRAARDARAQHAHLTEPDTALRASGDRAQTGDVLQLLRAMQSTWLTERQQLLTNTSRSVHDAGRLRDLTAFLAVLDPARRNELEPRVAERMLGAMLQEAQDRAQDGALVPLKIDPRDEARCLQLMLDGKCARPGGPVAVPASFNQFAAARGLSAEALVERLVARKLLSRKATQQLALAEAGFRLLMRFSDSVVVDGPGASISDSAAAVLTAARASARPGA